LLHVLPWVALVAVSSTLHKIGPAAWTGTDEVLASARAIAPRSLTREADTLPALSIHAKAGTAPPKSTDIETLSENQIRTELELVLSSATFQRSPKLRAFLRYVTEAVLDGSCERIKAYTIAVDALGRSPNFDPDADAIVRVDAVRLRGALKRYYEGEGARDPVVISFSPGSYVPKFSRAACAQPGTRQFLIARGWVIATRWGSAVARMRGLLRGVSER
jgi:hypothetical protein